MTVYLKIIQKDISNSLRILGEGRNGSQKVTIPYVPLNYIGRVNPTLLHHAVGNDLRDTFPGDFSIGDGKIKRFLISRKGLIDKFSITPSALLPQLPILGSSYHGKGASLCQNLRIPHLRLHLLQLPRLLVIADHYLGLLLPATAEISAKEHVINMYKCDKNASNQLIR